MLHRYHDQVYNLWIWFEKFWGHRWDFTEVEVTHPVLPRLRGGGDRKGVAHPVLPRLRGGGDCKGAAHPVHPRLRGGGDCKGVAHPRLRFPGGSV